MRWTTMCRTHGGRDAMLSQAPLASKYVDLSAEQLRNAILARKALLDKKLVILGHHYQQDSVVEFADLTGDSFRLSQLAAAQKDAEFVVFCGVHFMAESADILTDDRVKVILPDLTAGCCMADMATIGQLEDAWEDLTGRTDAQIVPITYVNSSAAVKAFCGGHDGACCTSSNARTVLEWALRDERPDQPSGRRKVLFLPDQHLGRNTAYGMGWPLDAMALYDPGQPRGGLANGTVRKATVLLWKGHCGVHQLFTAQQVDDVRAADPDCKVIVHPECNWSVVQKADLAGSTEYIIKTIDAAEPGSKWAVGTEEHLVHRLAKRHEGVKAVRLLSRMQCLCSTMYRINPRNLLWVLDELAEGRVVNQISVEPETKVLARIALDRMLSLAGTGAAGSRAVHGR
ncbi:MAG: quinolinate synthase NadA [Phycisphaerae bacterium]|nr:quinolinate synthase NadA [Phycisphaerae bacterium]